MLQAKPLTLLPSLVRIIIFKDHHRLVMLVQSAAYSLCNPKCFWSCYRCNETQRGEWMASEGGRGDFQALMVMKMQMSEHFNAQRGSLEEIFAFRRQTLQSCRISSFVWHWEKPVDVPSVTTFPSTNWKQSLCLWELMANKLFQKFERKRRVKQIAKTISRNILPSLFVKSAKNPTV